MSREVCAGRGAHRHACRQAAAAFQDHQSCHERVDAHSIWGRGSRIGKTVSGCVHVLPSSPDSSKRQHQTRLCVTPTWSPPPPVHSTLTTVKAGSNPRAAAESAWCHAGLLSGVMCTPTWCPCCSALATVVAVAPAASTSATTRHTTSSSTAARVSPCHAWVGRTGAGRPGGRGAAAAGPGGAAGALPGGRLAAGAAEACPGPGAPLPSAGCC